MLICSTSNSWSLRYECANLIITEKLYTDILNFVMKYELNKHYSKIKKKWDDCNKNNRRFMERNSNWLDIVITTSISAHRFPNHNTEACAQVNVDGRLQKEFGLCSERSKRRKCVKKMILNF